ncbi:hypothetical protein KFK09_002472 [Dendrobium nobile]|uniref:Uncharacterized protein n=1 Tax=Dendrobium nobile TaxID=94219 RepID=A0A8T3C3Y2_DENNO|nr:hypothetical protein KFK09_002472 [Dendrobium nobile]
MHGRLSMHAQLAAIQGQSCLQEYKLSTDLNLKERLVDNQRSIRSTNNNQVIYHAVSSP